MFFNSIKSFYFCKKLVRFFKEFVMINIFIKISINFEIILIAWLYFFKDFKNKSVFFSIKVINKKGIVKFIINIIIRIKL